jgi:hypothetical protein
MSERITIELSREEWAALVICAAYGASAIESTSGGHVAGLSDRAAEQIQSVLKIASLEDVAEALDQAEEITRRDFRNPDDITPSA